MTCQDTIRNGAYLSVYHLLDDLCFRGHVPPGSACALFKAIDDLRRISAPAEDIRLAETMSVAIRKLEGALRINDREQAEQARLELQTLGARWLQTPMRLSLN
jgi:hypothetical protein